MLNGEEPLLAAAQIALAFAGFGSLVSALIGEKDRWRVMEVIRLRMLIGINVSTALFALLPFLFFNWIENQAVIWAICSASFGAFMLVYFVLVFTLGRTPIQTHASIGWSIYAALIGAVGIGALFVNALGVFTPPNFSGYFLGVLLALVLGASYFVRLVIASGPRIEDARGG